MAVQITSKVNYLLNVPGPIDQLFEPRQIIVFPYIEYDSVINDERIVELIRQNRVEVLSLESGSPPLYNSEWNGAVKFRLGSYHFWVDSLGKMRIKFGDATSDFDGSEVGAGAVGPHGSTHVFDGPDPIPRIETLEGAFNTTVSENVFDLVYESAANTVRAANASSTLTMPALGIIISKPTPTTCIIARSGPVPGFVGLTPNASYYVGLVAGTMTTTPPSVTGQVKQRIGYAKDATTLVMEISEPILRA